MILDYYDMLPFTDLTIATDMELVVMSLIKKPTEYNNNICNMH